MALPHKNREETSAVITQTLGLILIFSIMLAVTAYAANPDWWSSPGTGSKSAVMMPQVTTNSGIVTTNYVLDDYAVVNQGQLKQFTTRAVDNMNATLPGGAGAVLNSMVNGWALDYAIHGYNAVNVKPSDYTVMTVGQLKYVGNAVWSRLVSAGYTNAAPAWLMDTNYDNAVANIGQLKTVFDFGSITTITSNIPVITSAATATASPGVAFSYAITASHFPNGFGASNLPSGLSINPGTGVISGTVSSTGVYSIGLSATNTAGTGSGALVLHVIASSNAPVINSPSAVSLLAGVSFAYQITASNNPILFSATGLPSGLSLNSSTGVISGAVSTTGTSTITLGASNGTLTGTEALTLTVLPAGAGTLGTAPILNDATSSAIQGQSYSYTISASGASSYGATGLPDGLSINGSTGVISGAPTVYGAFHITVIASNSWGSGTAGLTLTVAPGGQSITSGTLAVIPLNVPFYYQITSTLVSPTWSASGEPGWLNFDAADGILKGTPSDSGTFTIGLEATASGTSATSTLTIIATGLPIISSPLIISGFMGTPYEYVIQTENPADSFAVSLDTPLPPGLNLDPATGIISGTPTNMGTYLVNITAANSTGTSTETLAMTVGLGGQSKPAITSPTIIYTTAGQPFSYTITANNNATNFGISGNPSWITNNPTTGVLTGIPPSGGGLTITLNAIGAESTATGSLTIFANAATAHTYSKNFQNAQTVYISEDPNDTNVANYHNLGLEVGNYFDPDSGISGLSTTEIDRGLLAFDLSSIPPDAEITGVTLALQEVWVQGIRDKNPGTINIYQPSVPFNPATATWNLDNNYQTNSLSSLDLTTSDGSDVTETWTSTGSFVAAVQHAVATSLPLDLMLVSPTAEAAAPANPAQDFVFGDSVNDTAPVLTITYESSDPPLVTSSGSTTFTISPGAYWTSPLLNVGNPIGVTFSGSGSGGLSGLTMSGTGVISGTPTGSGTYTVTATNASGSTVINFAVNVVTPGSPPVITSAMTVTGTVGVPFTYQITATGSATSYSEFTNATGVSLNGTSGMLSINPTPSDVGTFYITLGAGNAYGVGTAVLSMTISPPPATVPVVYQTGTLTGNQGVGFYEAIPSDGQATNYTFSSALAGSLSSIGLSMNGSGIISGTPSGTGSFSGTITASDSVGSSSIPVSINIASLPAPVIQPLFIYAVDGVPINAQVSASVSRGAQANFSSGTASNFLAPDLATYGLAISGSLGSISGTVSLSVGSGTYPVTVTAQNVLGLTGTGAITLVTYGSGPGIQGPLTSAATVGQYYTYVLQTVSGAAPATSTSATGLPPGLSYVDSGANGTISGVPTTTGTYDVILTATNTGSSTTTSTATLVLAVNPSPAATSYTMDFQAGVSPTGTYVTPSVTIADDPVNSTVATETLSTTGTALPVGIIPSPANSSHRALSTALMSFNLSALPPDAIITSASLEATPISAGYTFNTLFLYLQVNSGFDPGTANWNNNDATYSALLNYVYLPAPSYLSDKISFSNSDAFTQAVQQAFNGSGSIYLTVHSQDTDATVTSTATLNSLGLVTRSPVPTQNPHLIVTYTLGNPTLKPAITSPAIFHGTVNSPANYVITASHSPTSFNATGLSSPFSVNTSTGVITGTGTTVGSTLITVSATNTVGTGSQQVIFNIDSVIQATGLSVATGSDGQTGLPGAVLSTPLTVLATTTSGTTTIPLPNTLVTFTVPADGGALSLTATSTPAATLSVPTNGAGNASVYFRLPYAPKTTQITATAGTAVPVVLTETAAYSTTLPSSGLTQLSIVSGDGQTGVSGGILSAPLVVQAVDAFGRAVPAATPLTFTAATPDTLSTSRTGTFSASQLVVPTDSSGRASVYWNPIGSLGAANQLVCSATNASPVTFLATIQGTVSGSLEYSGGSAPTTDPDPVPTSNTPGAFTLILQNPRTKQFNEDGSSTVIVDFRTVNLSYTKLGGDGITYQAQKLVDQTGTWTNMSSNSDSDLYTGHDYQYRVEAIFNGNVIGTTNVVSYSVPIIKDFNVASTGFGTGPISYWTSPQLIMDQYTTDSKNWHEDFSNFALQPGPPSASNGAGIRYTWAVNSSGSFSYDGNDSESVPYGEEGHSEALFEIDFNPSDTSSNLKWYVVDSTNAFLETSWNGGPQNGVIPNEKSAVTYSEQETPESGTSAPYDFVTGVTNSQGESIEFALGLQLTISDQQGYNQSYNYNITHLLTSSSDDYDPAVGGTGVVNDHDAAKGIVISPGNATTVNLVSPALGISGGFPIDNKDNIATINYNGPIEVEESDGTSLSSGSQLSSGEALIVFVDTDAPDGALASITITTTNFGSETRNFIINNPPDKHDTSIPLDEASGSRYRKIALNGLPMPDEKPQQSGETDQEKEETYIDALTDGLRHSTTDVYMPVSGSDLTVSARRDFRSQTWNNRSGLRPHEQPDLPFGPCWSSNLSANIHFTVDDDPNSTSPDQAIVTDETGAIHTFVLWYDSTGAKKFFPMPTAKNEQQTPNLESLTANSNGSPTTYTFSRKYGTTLTYEDTTLDLATNNDRLKGSLYSTHNKYARLTQAKDRVGNVIKYQFANPSDLVPEIITVPNEPSLNLYIQQQPISEVSGGDVDCSQSVITAIWDAKGNKTSYGYSAFSDETATTTADNKAYVLTSVTTADAAVTRYHYSADSDQDPSPQPTDVTKATYWCADLASITDPLTNEYSFTYRLDHAKMTYVSNSLVPGYYPQMGSPRDVATVSLPNSLGTTAFDNTKSCVELKDPVTLSQAIPRTLSVTDATGTFTRTYNFSNAAVVPVPKIPGRAGFSTTSAKVIAYQEMTLDYGTSTGFLGSETFNFERDAAMALLSIQDFSGNITTFAHTESWAATGDYLAFKNITGVSLVGFYDDPSSQTDALLQVKDFTYDPNTRIMTDVVNKDAGGAHVHDHTHYDVDSAGRRISEKIYDSGNNLVKETDFYYGNGTYPGFMTKKCVKALSGVSDPGWVKPLITTYVPDSNGRVAQEIVDPNGLNLITSYTYDANGNKLSATDPNGHTTWFSYDSRNRLVTVTNPDGSQKQMVYDARGNKTAEYDERGIATLYQYDALNRLVTQARDMNGNGTIDSGTDLVTTYTYDVLNSKTATRDPNGNSTHMTYDNLQRVTSITDALSHVTHFTYDGRNPGGNVFDSSSFKPTHTVDPRGFTTDVTYDALYRPTSKAVQYDPSQSPAATSMQYDSVGNVILTTDPLGHQVQVTYDALNRPIETTDADGTHTYTVYTSTGFKWKVTDQNGHATQTAYDTAGRPVSVTQPAYNDGSGTQAAPITYSYYDGAGNVVETMNPLGYKWDYSYDARNRKVQEFEPPVTDQDPNSPTYNNSVRPTLTWQYDVAGRVTGTIDARGNQASSIYKTSTIYDPANRAVMVTQPAVSLSGTMTQPVTHTSYDNNGNVLTVTDPNGNITTNNYDALNRLHTTSTVPVSGTTITVTNGYDEVGNKLSVKDGLNQTTQFSYDGLNRNTSITDAAGRATTLKYDAMNKTQRTDAMGQVTTYLYDLRNRLSNVVYASTAAANSQRNYCYDHVGNLLSVTEPSKTAANVAYTYDELNRVITETSQARTHHYVYDAAGNRISTVYGGTGRTLTNTYDALNRLNTLQDQTSAEVTSSGAGATGSGRLTAYGYDLNGNITQKVLPNTDVEKDSHDALNRNTEIQVLTGGTAVFSTSSQSYDLTGNLVQTVNYNPHATVPNVTVTNTYDGVNRLLSEVFSGNTRRTATYTYDLANNRLSETLGGVTINYVYNNLNQLVSDQNDSYTYDLNGNRLTDTRSGATDTYSYDFENRLIGLTKNIPWYLFASQTAGPTPGVFAYTYDYRTRRIVRDESGAGGVLTNLVFSGGTSVQEYDSGNSSPTVENLRGSDYGGGVGGILYTMRNVSGTLVPSYNHYNTRGDVISTTDSSGALAYQTYYEAFGRRVIELAPGSFPKERQRANTKDEDPTGLLDEGFRYRDLTTGSFITRDPAGFVDGPNLYCYVVQNPWTGFDPEGLTTEDIVKGYAQGATNGTIDFLNSISTLVNALPRDQDAPGASVQAPTISHVDWSGSATNKIDFYNGLNGGSFLGTVGPNFIPGVGLEEGLTSDGARLLQAGEKVAPKVEDAVAVNTENKGANAATTPTQTAASTTDQASAEVNTAESSSTPVANRPATDQPTGGNGQVLKTGEGATPGEMAASKGGPTGGSRAGQEKVRQKLIADAQQNNGGNMTCWRCGQSSKNPSNMHVGHRNVPTCEGGNLAPENTALEGASCNLSAGSREGTKAGRSCADRGSCGAPYGRSD